VEGSPGPLANILWQRIQSMVEGLRGMGGNVRDAASQVARESTQGASASDESARNSCDFFRYR